MTVIEMTMRSVQTLPVREQIKVATYAYQLSAASQQERAEMLQRTHGALDEEADGEAFEQAMNNARQIEPHG